MIGYATSICAASAHRPAVAEWVVTASGGCCESPLHVSAPVVWHTYIQPFYKRSGDPVFFLFSWACLAAFGLCLLQAECWASKRAVHGVKAVKKLHCYRP